MEFTKIGPTFLNAERGLWLAALVGAAAFLAITRGAILDPRDTDWLLSYPDTATAFLGWQFFRQAPLAQLPFGANPAYGMEMATSVVYSDSIPLLAFLFKPFSSALPGAFQYFGLWLASSFVLQSVLAYRLLVRFSPDRTLALIGSAFFVFAPAYLFRLSGHYALCGQWAVLAALYLYFAPRVSLRAWIILLAASALIHFYLLVMVGVIWAAGDLWQRRWHNEITTSQAMTHGIAGTAVTIAVLWFAGYFLMGNAGAPGFGIYRMNLLAPVDPDAMWSRLLPDRPGGPGDYEGFNYLGIGMLALAPLAGYALLVRRGGVPLKPRTLVPLLFVALFFTLVALSNRVALGSVELFAYELPGVLEAVAQMLRASGRMFWPVYYLLYVAILVLVFRGFTRRVAIGACALLLAAQVADGVRALRHYHVRLAHAPTWVSPLKSPLWAQIAQRYQRVVYVPPRNDPDTFVPWAVFAANHRLAINFGYFARVDAEKLNAARNDIEAAVLPNRLKHDSLYVFESETLWDIATAHPRPADVVGVLDGFRIIAPGLKACAACDPRALADVKREESSSYPLGERITFAAAATRRYAMTGWSLPEYWGTWSQSSIATLVIKLEQLPAHDLLLTVEGRAFVDDVHRQQAVDVSVNGASLGILTFVSPRDAESGTLRIPRATLAANRGLLRIGFAFRDARSPRELGLGDDARPRALGLMALRLTEAF